MFESARKYFEPRFARDFSQVRVHVGREAAETARALHAKAFTHGRNIVFGAGEYRPETTQGRKLIAHELAHVVQQKGRDIPVVRRRYALPELRHELLHRGAGARSYQVSTSPDVYFYSGTAANSQNRRAFVMAGIHGDEEQAKQLGRRVRSDMSGSGGRQPYFHTLVAPELNPGTSRRVTTSSGGSTTIDPNRSFGGATPVSHPIINTVTAIENEFQPERALSIHAIRIRGARERRRPLGGIYLDPLWASQTTPPSLGAARQREAAFTREPANLAGMQLTERMIGSVRRAGRRGRWATSGNVPGLKRGQQFPASRYPGTGAGASSYNLLYPMQSTIGTASGGPTSFGVWASGLTWSRAIITMEIPGLRGSVWPQFLPAVWEFLQASSPTAAPSGSSGSSTSAGSSPSSSSATPSSTSRPAKEESGEPPPEIQSKSDDPLEDRIQRNHITEADLPSPSSRGISQSERERRNRRMPMRFSRYFKRLKPAIAAKRRPATVDRRSKQVGNTYWHSLATSTTIRTDTKSAGRSRPDLDRGANKPPESLLKAVSRPGTGEPLSDSIRSRMEPVLGQSFRSVRVHTGPSARKAAESIHANAFTYGERIFLGKDRNKEDKRLLAHELTHVAQQRSFDSACKPVQCSFACPAGLEHEIAMIRSRLDALPPESSPEREDLQAQLTWRENLAAQCGALSGVTSSRADTLAYLKAEAMLHRGRIADASRELARMEPSSGARRNSLDNERDSHREELISVLEMRSSVLETEIASLRESILGQSFSEESSPERELLIQYENEWVAHQNELRPLLRWRARRRINSIQAEIQEINNWLLIVPQVCSPEEPMAEDLLNRRTALLEEQRRLVDFLTGSMVEYEQFDPRWGSTRYGTNPACTSVREAGCGPTSLAIVLNYLYSEDPEHAGAGGDIHLVEPPETVRYAETHGRVCNSGTAGDTMVTNVHTGWPGFRGRRISLDEATQYLRTGVPVIFLCRDCTGRTRSGSPSRYGGHYMVLRSVNEAGDTYRVLDPGRGERRDIETISFDELRRNNRGLWVIERD